MTQPATSPTAAAPAAGASLRKEVGALQFFTLGFGAIIGVGWVVVLGEWLTQAGPIGAVLGFALGGLLMMLVGLCYAELATSLPASGGEVVYAYEIFGLRASFAVGWLLALVYVTVTIFEGISVGWVVGTLLPGIEGPVLYELAGAPVRVGGVALGIGGTAVIAYLNYRGAASAARLQDVLTYGLLLCAMGFVGMGLLGGRAENLEPLFQRSAAGSIWPGVLAVFVTAPFWFAGFNVIPQLMEERAAGTPLRTVGRVILLSIALAIGFYTLVILSAAMAVPWQRLVGAELPAAAAFRVAFDSGAAADVVLVAAVLGLVTTWNTVFIAASRVLFALGRARIIPAAYGRVHPVHGSPGFAVVFVALVAGFGVLIGRSAILPIVSVAGTCLAFAFLVSCLGVVRLRLSGRALPHAYRLPGGLATALLASLASLFVLCMALYQPWASRRAAPIPVEWVVLAAWGALGVVFWVVARRVRGGIDEAERRRIILGPAAELPSDGRAT